MPRLITFLSDFGLKDSYVAEVKAVLLSGVASARVVDITHEIPPFDIEAGAFQLMRSFAYFSPSAIHLGVVDPGVGTSRRAVFVKVGSYRFIGPDNGLLLWAVQACEKKLGKAAKIYEIPVQPDAGRTFHGRDIFAPFIVSLLRGKKMKLQSVLALEGRPFPSLGEIVHADHFGNLVTSIPAGSETSIEGYAGKQRVPLLSAENYLAIPEKGAAFIRGSHGFWEIACRRGSAADFLRLQKGDSVIISSGRKAT